MGSVRFRSKKEISLRLLWQGRREEESVDYLK